MEKPLKVSRMGCNPIIFENLQCIGTPTILGGCSLIPIWWHRAFSRYKSSPFSVVRRKKDQEQLIFSNSSYCVLSSPSSPCLLFSPVYIMTWQYWKCRATSASKLFWENNAGSDGKGRNWCRKSSHLRHFLLTRIFLKEKKDTSPASFLLI